MIDRAPKAKGDANKVLAGKIAEAIKRSERTAASIAEDLGISPQAVNGWKKTGTISKDMLTRFAELVGVPVGYFIGDMTPASTQFQLPVIGPMNGDKMLKLFVLFAQSTEDGQDLILRTAEFAAKKTS